MQILQVAAKPLVREIAGLAALGAAYGTYKVGEGAYRGAKYVSKGAVNTVANVGRVVTSPLRRQKYVTNVNYYNGLPSHNNYAAQPVQHYTHPHYRGANRRA